MEGQSGVIRNIIDEIHYVDKKADKIESECGVT